MHVHTRLYQQKKPAGNIDTVLTVCRRTVNLLFPFWFQNLYNKIKPLYFTLFPCQCSFDFAVLCENFFSGLGYKGTKGSMKDFGQSTLISLL